MTAVVGSVSAVVSVVVVVEAVVVVEEVAAGSITVSGGVWGFEMETETIIEKVAVSKQGRIYLKRKSLNRLMVGRENAFFSFFGFGLRF